ncbi:hypothetical protein EUGRSUZ_K01909 [Eucalyptus grandis]|uniref:Uncharacterized protein n=2 Tax=Eucalyptus grandis TaxID=71139 RepID=A0ACC3IWW5_EUCGR|nr:hypothetical protein EUGRSUZ_K01909 [Eucalyptus grandis]
MFGKKKNLLLWEKSKMESVQLEHENVTKFVLVILWDEVKEGRRFSNEENDPMTSKELNEEPYEVKISCMVL